MFYIISADALKLLGAGLAAFVLTIAVIKTAGNKLPRDKGREFAVQGALSQGKIRGAGILMMIVFAIVSVAASGFAPGIIVYDVLLVLSMLTGYLDDCAAIPWSEAKKGILDLVLCLLISVAVVYFEPEAACLDFIAAKVEINKILYVFLATVFQWLMINAVNCADGIDGLCGGLSINSIFFACVLAAFMGTLGKVLPSAVIMIAVLLGYLVFNTEPSSVLMGDAGSRPLGMFIGLMFLRMGNALFAIPICIMLLADGLIGLVKVSAIRYLKLKNFMANIRTPLHDHERKNKGASNAQVRYRFNLIQILVSVIFLCALLQIVGLTAMAAY